MIKLLQWLIWGYVPKWVVLKEVELNTYADRIGGTLLTKGTRYVMQCEQTGKIKFRDST